MDKEGTTKLVKLLIRAYPTTYKGISDEEMKDIMRLWYEMFGEYPESIVALALKNYIKANQYPPTVAGLQEQIDLLGQADNRLEMWNCIAKALRNSTYHSAEEFAKLPETCKEFVGSPMALKEMGQTDPQTVNTVVRGQFLKQAESSIRRRKAVESLPQDVREALTGVKMIGG